MKLDVAHKVVGSTSSKSQAWMAALFMMSLGFALLVPLHAALAAPAERGWLDILAQWAPLIFKGFCLNVAMSLVAVVLGTLAGGALGIGQCAQTVWVKRISWLVTEFFRNSPTLVLLFFCMYLLPFQVQIGPFEVPFPAWAKAILGLSLSKTAYVSEIVRGAFASIPSTQWEAAETLAFSRWQTIRMIILPQCLKRMLPPWMNAYAIMIMATPLASVLGVNEGLTFTRAAITAVGRPDMLTPFYLYLLALFFIYAYPISAWTIRLERRYAVRS